MSRLWNWMKWVWHCFETWVAAWAPGLKTKIVSLFGAVGSGAVVLQQYVQGIPDNRFITETQIGILGFVLFTLAFWLRDIGARTSVEAD